MANDKSNNKKRKVSADSDTKMMDVETLKYDCPVHHCERKYKREITLLTHVLTDHRKIYNKIMNIVNDKESVGQICNSVNDTRSEMNGEAHQTMDNGTQTEEQYSMAIVRRNENGHTRNIPSTSTAANETDNIILKQIKQSPNYHLQMNETLDIKDCSYVIVTVRYKLKNSIQEDVLFTKKCANNTTADDILNSIFDLISIGGLDANKCSGLSMDGVRDARIPLKDIMQFSIQKGLDIKILTYNFTRRAEFISQHLPPELKTVLKQAVQYINEQKTTDLQAKFCAGMDDMAKQIFLHTDQYWLSYGNVLTRLFELRGSFTDQMIDPDWLCRLAYLADIFERFERFYQQLNENDSSIFQIYSEFESMIDTLKMDMDQFGWHATTASYRNLQIFLSELSRKMNPSILLGIQRNLKKLSNHLQKYLPMAESEIKNCEWIINPFKFNVYNVPEDLVANETEYGELMGLRKNLQKSFSYKYEKLELFWTEVFEMYPNISKRALQILLIFKTSRLSESEFGKLLVADSENVAIK